MTASCESLPLRGRWHRVSDVGRSLQQPFLFYPYFTEATSLSKAFCTRLATVALV